MHNLLAVSLICFALPLQAQHAHDSPTPTETGQAQFAAIAEIVAQLRVHPGTDWSKVNIDALRAHLIDMENVNTRAETTMSIDGRKITFQVTGEPDVAASIQRMLTAHGPMLAAETGWSVDVSPLSDGAVLTVAASSEEQISQIKGLGFFGLMTIGAHHQQHHLMIALGHDPH